jgi:hypothetical protein
LKTEAKDSDRRVNDIMQKHMRIPQKAARSLHFDISSEERAGQTLAKVSIYIMGTGDDRCSTVTPPALSDPCHLDLSSFVVSTKPNWYY